jgi:hypothetical protein
MRDAMRTLGIDRIVTTSGSTRFWSEMVEADRRETAAGRLVLKPGCNLKEPHDLWADPDDAQELKARLDELHRAKIRACDEVLVVAPGGYVGDSTRAEVAYAEELGKPVRYWKPEPRETIVINVTSHQPVTAVRRLQEKPDGPEDPAAPESAPEPQS